MTTSSSCLLRSETLELFLTPLSPTLYIPFNSKPFKKNPATFKISQKPTTSHHVHSPAQGQTPISYPDDKTPMTLRLKANLLTLPTSCFSDLISCFCSLGPPFCSLNKDH